MSKLSPLRGKLSSLRRARSSVRHYTAFSAVITGALLALAGVFVLDYAFKLDVAQRLVVMAIGLAGIVWAYGKYARPMLGITETDEDMALMVERQQRIHSDLIAALQFESPQADKWGSRQLENAVIDHVGSLSKGLNVFEGFSREQMKRRGVVLGITTLVVILCCFQFPQVASVFFNRLCLGNEHYPTRTNIEQVVINQRGVLQRSEHGTSPSAVKLAESFPVQFLVQCTGELPDDGEVRVVSADASRRRREVTLEKLTLDSRRQRLQDAAERIEAARADATLDVAGPWTEEVVTLLAFDAPEAAEAVTRATAERSSLAAAETALQHRLDAWPGDADTSALYLGRLQRLVDSVRYTMYLGDAFTDPAQVEMIPLPIVQATPRVSPPAYARQLDDEEAGNARQLSVIEGSDVALSIRCSNGKKLEEVWITATAASETKRYDLVAQEGVWQFAAENSPFQNVAAPISFDIQVTDEDGLHLETPFRGNIRIRTDRVPHGTAGIVHNVVLPTATPVIEYRVNDDFGIAKIDMHVQVERAKNRSADEVALVSAQEDEKHVLAVFDGEQPILAAKKGLPLQAAYTLNLSSFGLAKGDRLKLTMEFTDYRGDQPGKSYLSDPLVLEVSDESGVLAAISEADERSEERLSDIIKRQLGIGESP